MALCYACHSALVPDLILPPSPIPGILGKNVMPLPANIMAIRGVITDLRPEVTRLQDEIVLLEEVLDCLYHQQEKVKHYIQAHESALAPIHQVPVEVLDEILYLYYLSSDNGLYGVIRSNDGPMLLAQICRLWRQITINNPRYFSHMRFDLPESHPEGTILIAQLWLERSQPSPLRIVLETPPDTWRSIDVRVFDALSEHVDRWQHIDISLSPLLLGCRREFFEVKNMPMLESLALRGLDGQEFTDYPGFDDLSAAPRLRELTLGTRTNFFRTINRYP